MTEIARLKPDPIPVVHPVPEYAATGKLAETYARTKASLCVPWMGVVTMAFAHYPRFYDCLWNGIEDVVVSESFARACDELRACAEEQAARLKPPPILFRLGALGYDRSEVDEIRACNEVFSAGNMPYLLIASLARLLLEGERWHGTGPAHTRRTPRLTHPRPILIEPHHAEAAVVGLYADIRDTLGLPFVNTDYRAFARWPSYFSPAWADLKAAIVSPSYEARVFCVHERALSLVAALPNVIGLDSKTLRAAAAEDASPQQVLSVVRLFQWLLPGLATNVAFLREQLVEQADA
ncbi:MAG: hypothetical protein R3E83_05440 [Burkholderiaceae bacterium]